METVFDQLVHYSPSERIEVFSSSPFSLGKKPLCSSTSGSHTAGKHPEEAVRQGAQPTVEVMQHLGRTTQLRMSEPHLQVLTALDSFPWSALEVAFLFRFFPFSPVKKADHFCSSHILFPFHYWETGSAHTPYSSPNRTALELWQKWAFPTRVITPHHQ